jgi:glycosyltransferase involved in cell wall biosynthesis
MADRMNDLSIVLITRQQAWNIARLVESVLKATRGLPLREIVLVDSASTDRTVDIACGFPIRILRLRPGQRLSPAAGRYVGFKHIHGDLVLFLDGDMELHPGWLEKALHVVRKRPEVAVVTGQVIDVPQTAGLAQRPPSSEHGAESATEVPTVGGAALYRRHVLEQVGTFNPYLLSEEEPELCLRIRHAGYRLVRLEVPLAYHYGDQSAALGTLVARWRRNFYLGVGQSIRYHLRSRILWAYLKERGYGCFPALGLAAGLIAFFDSLKSGQWFWLGLWLGMLSVVILADAYRKRNLFRAFVNLLQRLFYVDGMVRGFLLKPLDPSSYPATAEIIQ